MGRVEIVRDDICSGVESGEGEEAEGGANVEQGGVGGAAEAGADFLDGAQGKRVQLVGGPAHAVAGEAPARVMHRFMESQKRGRRGSSALGLMRDRATTKVFPDLVEDLTGIPGRKLTAYIGKVKDVRAWCRRGPRG
jgi:hypothetical protein